MKRATRNAVDRAQRQQDLRSRDAIVDHAADAVANLCPAFTFDQVLLHPHTALQVARYVCRKLHRPFNDHNIHEVLKTALNARKRGFKFKRDRH